MINNNIINQNQIFNNNNIQNMNLNNGPMPMKSMNVNHQYVNNEEKDDDLYINEPEDIYPYIKESKKEIILVTSDDKRKRILIPESLRKNELYYTSTKFRCHEFSEIKLYHNTVFLHNDDTSIECISNGDIIKINEYLDIDSSFYKTLLLKYKNSKMINIGLLSQTGFKVFRYFPVDITVMDMIKAFSTEIGVPFKYLNLFVFSYNGKTLNINSKELIKDCFRNMEKIIFSKMHSLIGGDPFIDLKIGKVIEFNIKFKNSKGNFKYSVGTLAQIKEFYNGLKRFLLLAIINKKLDKVILNPGNIEINKDDERTFSAIGIREDFECILNFIN